MPGPVSSQYKGPKGHMPLVPSWWHDNPLKRYVEYIVNTSQSPLACQAFDEDWAPIGPMARREMVEAGLIEEWAGGLMLTDAGEALCTTPPV